MRLMFNAPMLEACYLKDQVWTDIANPPDLVTLFPSGFFADNFKDTATVYEHFEHCGARDNLKLAMRRAFSSWRAPAPIKIDDSIRDYKSGRSSGENIAERVLLKLAKKSGLLDGRKIALDVHEPARVYRWIDKRPTPFGYYVDMRSKAN